MNPYVTDVARHLSGVRRADRDAALRDLEELLATGVTPAELGPAEEYAAGLREQLGRPRFRFPGGLWMGREARARLWAPADPRLFVPRSLGIGWDLNVGALAVRLGWLRPDDADADVFAAIPAGVRAAQRAVPVALAALSVPAAIGLWRQGRRLPTNFDAAGRVNRWVDRRWLIPVVGGNAVIAAWGATHRPEAVEQDVDTVVRPALATTAGAFTVAYLLAARSGARRPDAARPWVGPVLALTPVAAQLAATVLPVRAGLARVAQGQSSGEREQ
ncbi:DUF5808 domain-containing protein [Granulicoccus sp. GXG6511]|uniref:DUF5808 domain-containing protein n=1 Tax=Granulicoccus sp. GXG6511 TaxID=3381351 RepID=UPI003D7ED414